jgi:hypothetical protein
MIHDSLNAVIESLKWWMAGFCRKKSLNPPDPSAQPWIMSLA